MTGLPQYEIAVTIGGYTIHVTADRAAVVPCVLARAVMGMMVLVVVIVVTASLSTA